MNATPPVCDIYGAPPAWVREIVESARHGTGPEALMAIALTLAAQNVRHGGSPFGAVIATAAGDIIDVGWNSVIASQDSTAHAEIVAIRRAQRALKTDALEESPRAPFSLFTSAAPCIQCFGALYWAGISTVYASARKEDVESVGFDEGPITPDLWSHAKTSKNIVYVPDFCRGPDSLKPFQEYQRISGKIY